MLLFFKESDPLAGLLHCLFSSAGIVQDEAADVSGLSSDKGESLIAE